MREKNNKLQSIVLAVLVCATTLVYWFGKSDNKYDVDPALFRNYDLKAVDEIALESSTGRIDLKYTGSRWKVNEHFNASAEMVEVLFATLQQAEVRRPVAASQQDSVTSAIKTKGVKVSLLSKGGVSEVFYAGGNESRTQAVFVKENDNVPYVMTIPGYRVYVSGIFELQESGWRDKIVFAFNWRNFQRLEVNFPGFEKNNFNVAMDDGYFGIEGQAAIDTTRLNDYLDDVSLLVADEFVSTNASLDSLSRTRPLVSFVVKDIARKEYLLQLFPQAAKGQEYYGLVDSTQWARFDGNKISQLLRGRNFFQKSK